MLLWAAEYLLDREATPFISPPSVHLLDPGLPCASERGTNEAVSSMVKVTCSIVSLSVCHPSGVFTTLDRPELPQLQDPHMGNKEIIGKKVIKVYKL